MAEFTDRQREFRELDAILQEKGAHFVLVYGRRRVGKTTLLLNWVQRTGLPYLYWIARRETPDTCRQDLALALWRWAYPGEADLQPPRFELWSRLFEQMARMIGDRPVVLIFDEFPYAVESDPSFPSNLQAAWDQLLKDKPVTLILSGSHIGMMVEQLEYRAPLYGRITAQLPVEPLPYATLQDFFPRYPAAERVAAYAVLGGVPAYLERFDDRQTLSANLRRHLFRRAGMFRSEPMVLISDLVRETRTYESVLRAIATGNHTPAEIAGNTGLNSANLPPYLTRLRDLGLIERRVPATIPPDLRRTTTRSRYHLRDSYLRFYFRFIEPNLSLIEQELTAVLWDRIGEQFRAFIGATAFEDLCREWVLAQARAGNLPIVPELVGSHWSQEAQVDVVAINWRDRAILLGECKWGAGSVDRAIVRELVEKAPKVVPGADWQVHYAYFGRAGFTDAARAEAEAHHAILVDLDRLDTDLRKALESA
ncbi:MAG TPA: ATP-binding protein [Anaerolineae bacterium]